MAGGSPQPVLRHIHALATGADGATDAHLLEQFVARRDERPSIPLPDPLDEITWREVQQVLDAELQRLPERYRLPIVLCYLEGRTRDEAAAQLGWTAQQVKGQLERGRERLRGRLVRR